MNDHESRLVRPRFARWSLVIFLLVLPVAVHAAWDYAELRALKQETDAIAARHEPISLTSSPRLLGESGESDRAYRAAGVLAGEYEIDSRRLFARVLEAQRNGEWPNDLVGELRSLVERRADALALADMAADLRFEGFSSPSLSSLTWVRGGLFRLQSLLGIRAALLAFAGDADGAAASLYSEARLSRIFEDDSWISPPGRILAHIQTVAERVRMSSRSLSRVADALAASDRDDGLRRSLLTDRARMLDYTLYLRSPRHLEEPLLRPWRGHWFNRQLRTYDLLIAATNRSWPGQIDEFIAVAAAPGADPLVANRESLQVRVWSIGEELSRLRSARVVIAIERYRRDHGEKAPATLDGLVPTYLDVVPIDPFSGRPLLYVARPESYSVYGIAHNRRDEGGRGLRPQAVWSPLWRRADFAGDVGAEIRHAR